MSKLSKTRLKEIENAAKNRREIVEARLSRRDLMRMGLRTAGGMLVAKHGLSARAAKAGMVAPINDPPPGPTTVPFVDELPIPPVAQGSTTPLTPAPTIAPLPGESRMEAHQRYNEFFPQKYYEFPVREGLHKFHRDLSAQTIWGFNGITPGVTYHAYYNEPILVRLRNELPAEHVGYGDPTISTHQHNGHTPSESDGFPTNYNYPGSFYDYHYPNVRAGVDAYGPGGDERETMNTLWYHDHRKDFTAQNSYKGLAGFYLLFDERDSNNENDTNPNAFRLPSGQYDVPLFLADKVFTSSGELFFDLFNLDGILGNKFTVNGKIQPVFRVARRKYRFRILDGGPSRFYQLYLTNGTRSNVKPPMTMISNDGNLLPFPIPVNFVRLSVAERRDVIVDFTNCQIGDEIYLENRLVQDDGRGPDDTLDARNKLLKFVVDRDAPDPSRIPAQFRALPTIPNTEVKRTRTWRFERQNGQWAVNGQLFNEDIPRAVIPKGDAEEWVLQNNSGGWHHPIHIHFEEFQILSRNGRPAAGIEVARKDVVELGPNEEIRIRMRFRDFVGKYVMHCHNTLHEDHAMMIRWDIQG